MSSALVYAIIALGVSTVNILDGIAIVDYLQSSFLAVLRSFWQCIQCTL